MALSDTLQSELGNDATRFEHLAGTYGFASNAVGRKHHLLQLPYLSQHFLMHPASFFTRAHTQQS